MFSKNRSVVVLILICGLASMLSVSSAFAGSHKVEICHRPPENPDNVQLISVSLQALLAHLAHGDHWSFGGACYVLVSSEEPLFFDEWEEYCAANFGGHMTSIHSDEEDDFVSFVVDPDETGGITALIGGYRDGSCTPLVGWEGAWSDGTPWDYENWREFDPSCASGEPRCIDGPRIQFWPNTNGCLSGWNDVGDSAWRLSVCRYEP